MKLKKFLLTKCDNGFKILAASLDALINMYSHRKVIELENDLEENAPENYYDITINWLCNREKETRLVIERALSVGANTTLSTGEKLVAMRHILRTHLDNLDGSN